MRLACVVLTEPVSLEIIAIAFRVVLLLISSVQGGREWNVGVVGGVRLLQGTCKVAFWSEGGMDSFSLSLGPEVSLGWNKITVNLGFQLATMPSKRTSQSLHHLL